MLRLILSSTPRAKEMIFLNRFHTYGYSTHYFSKKIFKLL